MEDKELEKETADGIKEPEEESTQEDSTPEGNSQEESAVQEETAAPETEESAEQQPPYLRSGRGIRISGPMLYENSFTITQEIFQEYLKAFMGRYRRMYYAMGGASFILGALSLLGGVGISALLFFVITILCIFLPANTYRNSKNKKYTQQVEKNGGKPLERRVAFYMSGLEVYSNNGAHSVFRYGDITRIIASRSLYVLVIKKKLSLLVLKDSFTKGTLEEWKTFMNKKGLWKVK